MKKTWKIICIAVIAVLIAILIMNNSTSARDIGIQPEKNEVTKGDDFEVTITIPGTESGYKSANGVFVFSISEFSYKGYEVSIDGIDSPEVQVNQSQLGRVAFLFYPKEGEPEENLITNIVLKLKFQAIGKTTTEEDNMNIEYLTVDTETYNNISKKVTVIEPESENPELGQTSPITLKKGETYQLTVVNNQSITGCESKNSEVATVDDSGFITAVNAGETIITVTTDNGEAQITVIVEENLPVEDDPIPVMKLSETDIPVKLGDTSKKIKVYVDNTEYTSGVVWSSSDTSKVIVGEGNIIPRALGTATITATTVVDGNTLTATATVTVMDGDNPIVNPSGDRSLTVGQSEQMSVDRKVTWESSDISVATVDSNGKITAVKAGIATITATDANGKVTSFKVTVVAKNNSGSGNSSGSATGTTNKTSNGTTSTGNSSSSANTAVPATGENSVETLAVLVIVTLFVASIIFRRKSKLK